MYKICSYSVTKACPTLCNPMDYSMPGSSFLPCLPELIQTHVCRVSNAMQPSHTLPPPTAIKLNMRKFYQISLHLIEKHCYYLILVLKQTSCDMEYSEQYTFVHWIPRRNKLLGIQANNYSPPHPISHLHSGIERTPSTSMALPGHPAPPYSSP